MMRSGEVELGVELSPPVCTRVMNTSVLVVDDGSICQLSTRRYVPRGGDTRFTYPLNYAGIIKVRGIMVLMHMVAYGSKAHVG